MEDLCHLQYLQRAQHQSCIWPHCCICWCVDLPETFLCDWRCNSDLRVHLASHLFPYQDSPFIVSQGPGCFSKLPKSFELGSKSTTSLFQRKCQRLNIRLNIILQIWASKQKSRCGGGEREPGKHQVQLQLLQHRRGCGQRGGGEYNLHCLPHHHQHHPHLPLHLCQLQSLSCRWRKPSCQGGAAACWPRAVLGRPPCSGELSGFRGKDSLPGGQPVLRNSFSPPCCFRWKERFCILTRDYLHCFKKGSTQLTECGPFLFKVGKVWRTSDTISELIVVQK